MSSSPGAPALAELLGEALAAPDGVAVPTASLPARGVTLIGLYFGYCGAAANSGGAAAAGGAGAVGPGAQLAASLAAFYARFQPSAQGDSGSGAAPEGQRLEIVFVSAEQDQQRWQEATRAMPWLALPFADKRRKLKLWNKFRVSNIPSLIFIDAATGKVVCRNGLLVIRDDPEGLEFPWGPRPFSEVVAGPLLRNSGQAQESTILEGSHVGVYFSAHWCPPCRSLTRVLVESYRKIKESGQKFEIVFVSADRSEDSFKQYFSEMPWLAIPYADEGRRSRLNRLYGIQGIPTLIVLDPKGDVITRQGRVEVLNDVECKEFPWHPKPVLELTDSNAVQLNEGPCLVLFVDSDDDGESEAAKQLIQPIAEKIIAKYKAKDEEAPLLFFVAGEYEIEKRFTTCLFYAVRDFMHLLPCNPAHFTHPFFYVEKWKWTAFKSIPTYGYPMNRVFMDDMTDSLRDYTNLPEAAPLLTILDMSARAKYVMDVEEITPDIVEAFVNDFLADKLKPEPI